MKFFTLILAVFISLSSFAQTGFTGTIKYDITYAGESAEEFAAFSANSYTLYLGVNKMRFDMEGGMVAMMMGYIVTIDDQMYMIKDNDETIYTFPKAEEETTEDVSEIKKTTETKVILGHTCTKYTITSESEGTTATVNMWVANDIKAPTSASGAGQGTGGLFNSQIDGLTLMMETEVMGVTMIIKASTIDLSTPADSFFELPSNYETTEFDSNGMFGTED